MKIPHSNLFQGEHLFPEGSNYLLVLGKYIFPVNNYWEVLFLGEYLLTVTPEITVREFVFYYAIYFCAYFKMQFTQIW